MATTQTISSVALVVGVTGMAGLNIAQTLKNHQTQGGPWIVYGAARRSKPLGFPPLPLITTPTSMLPITTIQMPLSLLLPQ